MYSHLIKGFTLGHLLMRRLGRTLLGAIGLSLDAFIVAPLYAAQSGSYSGFWDEGYASYYADGTQVNGFFQVIFGWIGDIIGAAVGAVLGSILGGLFYFPDAVLRLLAWAHDQVHEGFNALADLIGAHSLFNDFSTYLRPQSYLGKAWNLSVGTLGLVLGAAFAVVPKAIEFCLPFLGDGLSRFLWKTGGLIGGVVGVVISCGIWPLKHVCNKAVDLFRGFRDFVRSCTAFVYAKTNSEPEEQNRDCCLPNQSMHSQEFRNKVNEYKERPTTQILFGRLNVQRGEQVQNEDLQAQQGQGQGRPEVMQVQEEGAPDNNNQPQPQHPLPPEGQLNHVQHGK